MADSRGHWSDVYSRSAVTDVSWFEAEPHRSLELIAAAEVGADAPIIDVGGGASVLVDRLLNRGHRDVTVLDVAQDALAVSRSRLGERAGQVDWLVADLLTWRAERRYRLWHDRAVFHFLADPADRDHYREALRAALAPGGHVVVGTFAADGPADCSGLPTHRYTVESLAAQFPNYQLVQAVRDVHRTPAGSIQPFSWILLTSPHPRAPPPSRPGRGSLAGPDPAGAVRSRHTPPRPRPIVADELTDRRSMAQSSVTSRRVLDHRASQNSCRTSSGQADEAMTLWGPGCTGNPAAGTITMPQGATSTNRLPQ
jgi:SAM-dependent methyltransferase